QRADACNQGIGEAAGIEPLPSSERVLGVLLQDGDPDGAQPVERLVEPLPDEPLQAYVPARALVAELLPLAMAPDDARAQQHRTARPRALLVDDRVEAEFARADGGDETRHPRSCDDHLSEKLGLCSTYSMRMPSGPVRKAAYVFGASTVDSTSTPSSSASATTSSAESTSTAR